MQALRRGPQQRARQAGAAGLVAVLALAALLAACAGSGSDTGPATTGGPTTTGASLDFGSDDVTAGTTAPTTRSEGLGEGWARRARGRTPLRGFSEVAVTVTSGDGTTCEVCLLGATTSEQRERGLMEITDPELGGYDGMLFEYPEPVDGAFWMRNTPMALSIAYFDADRVVVSTTDMAPCEDSTSCTRYPADAPFQYALEVPEGELADLGVVGRASIEVTATRCPLAS